MAHRQFSASLGFTAPGLAAVNFTGYLDRAAASDLAELEAGLRSYSARVVELNLAAVDGLDGTGLQLLASFSWKLHKAGYRLTAAAAPHWFTRLLLLTRLDSILNLDPATPGAAMAVNLEWSPPVTHLDCADLPAHTITVNACHRLPVPPFSGFGPLWQRTYRVPIPGVSFSPAEVMAAWTSAFSSFWPAGNELLTPAGGIQPGSPAVIHLSLPAGMKVYTGALVMHSCADSFSLVTLQGHMFCGWITFSSFVEDGMLYIQTQALIRPSDPLFDLTYRLGLGARAEDAFWHAALRNLAAHFGVQAKVQQTNLLIDRCVQWKHFGNLWYNAGIRSVLYSLTHPFAARKFTRGEQF